MKIIKAANLFYKIAYLLKYAFIPTRQAIPIIKSQLKYLSEKIGPEAAERYLFLFEQAFSAHDALYDVIDQTLSNSFMSKFKRKEFDVVAEESMKDLMRLVDFIKNHFNDISVPSIDGRFNAVSNGFNKSLEYYYQYILPKEKIPPETSIIMSMKFHSTYHGLLDYLLRNTVGRPID